jgi:hypothetical protein
MAKSQSMRSSEFVRSRELKQREPRPDTIWFILAILGLFVTIVSLADWLS